MTAACMPALRLNGASILAARVGLALMTDRKGPTNLCQLRYEWLFSGQ
jgi:hypothetical protein